MTDKDRIKILENRVRKLEEKVGKHQAALETALEILSKQIEFNLAVQDLAREIHEKRLGRRV